MPDPSTITIPDISTSDPNILANGYKFFIFYNPSIKFETAYADFAECYSFLPAGFLGRALPGFTPWIAAPPPAAHSTINSNNGLVGVAVNSALYAIIMPKLQRGKDYTVLRRCMETRGYVRYAVPEAAWHTLNDPDNPMMIAMQAKVATGQKPPQPEVIDQ